MRMVRVWLFAFIFMFVVTVVWYISQPVVIGFARGINATVSNQNGRNTMLAIEYASYAWGPVLLVFILLWALISSQQRDVESVLYG